MKLYREPILIPALGDVPETVYTFLYIRQPDPYRSQVGDVDFVLSENQYQEFKSFLQAGEKIEGARIFPRPDLDMVELYHPDRDALAYVGTETATQKVRVKQ